MVQGVLKMAGVDAEFKPGEPLPAEAIAVTQSIKANVFEIEVRPQKALPFGVMQ